jgi:hypothetical protein
MTGFTFVNLPKGEKGGKGPDPLLAAFAEALRGNPGQWAVWPKDLASKTPQHRSSIAGKIRQGNYAGFPKGEFEATSRAGAVYVRYIGGGA